MDNMSREIQIVRERMRSLPPDVGSALSSLPVRKMAANEMLEVAGKIMAMGTVFTEYTDDFDKITDSLVKLWKKAVASIAKAEAEAAETRGILHEDPRD